MASEQQDQQQPNKAEFIEMLYKDCMRGRINDEMGIKGIKGIFE